MTRRGPLTTDAGDDKPRIHFIYFAFVGFRWANAGTLPPEMPLTESLILDALRAVVDPDLHRDIVTLGFVKNVLIVDGTVSVEVELTTPACPVKEILQVQCQDAILALEGVTEATVSMTAQLRARSQQQDDLIPGVKRCLAIASGKGGVGKSTVTVNLAVALARTGAKVGLLDADVYGPSIPMMMGAQNDKPLVRENKKIVPIQRYGVHMMSLGFLMEEGQAVLWRGPMVAGTVKQLLADVDWGELDYLLVDLPPGTGDAPMSLAQLAPLTGVVIVTTPHQVAASIAAKSVQLFRRLNTTVLGVVENMGAFVCPVCGTSTRVFAGTTGEELAQKLGVAYLGGVPLDPVVSASGDAGVPSIIAYPDRPQADAFAQIAGKLAQQASIASMAKSEPALA
jgi:ATP-binding protein involved in chromosome partitioning